MAEKNFTVNGSLDVDGVTIDLTGSQTGMSLHRIGTSITPKYETPIGTVSIFAGFIDSGKTNLPAGWLLCDGFEIIKTTTTYADLFAVIGTRYGETNGSGGSGTSHFRLPNMVDSFPIGHIGTNLDAPISINSTNNLLTLHQHTFQYSGNVSNIGGHAHNVDGGGFHNHGASSSDAGNETHNLPGAGITHTHNYSRGTGTSTSTGFADTNHGHVLNATDITHSHTSSFGGGSAIHNHPTSQSANLDHLHSVTMSQVDSNQTQNNSSHFHGTGWSTVKVFFIIKALQVV